MCESRNVISVALVGAILSCALHDQCAAQEERADSPPQWDQRGHGELVWQGVACLDSTDDGLFTAVGTIAPPCDPNVFLIGPDGRIVWQHAVGQRWIERVAVAPKGEVVYAVCTMPEGRPGERPFVYRVNAAGAVKAFATATGPPRLGVIEHGDHFHYGEHSNHIPPLVAAASSAIVGLERTGVRWLEPDAAATAGRFPRAHGGLNVSMTVGRSGTIVVGRTAPIPAGTDDRVRSLFLFHPDRPEEEWTRDSTRPLEAAPDWAPGSYGAPTLPDGSAGPLPQRDARISAPLSVAIFEGQGESGGARQWIAAADYEGWERTVTSAASGREESYGVNFPPTRPTVSVYDQSGRLVQRFDPARFSAPLWCDLVFSNDGGYLLAWPHNWTARGLAGQSLLPADDVSSSVHVLDISNGEVHEVRFPDASADLATSPSGLIVASCWNGNVYAWSGVRELSKDAGSEPSSEKWLFDVGAPARVQISDDGSRVIVAATNGVVHCIDSVGQSIWTLDLNTAARHGEKQWLTTPRTQQIATGVWRLPVGRTESDSGSQILIEAPQGLILIEGHAGLSFELEWEAIRSLGLNPEDVQYILATHEHGDHAPGAYLWRVRTGAQFICSEEMAYVLQHHLPAGTGYGFHPPVPTDIQITEDTVLDLGGLQVAAIRLPGHTSGSMGWRFEKDGRRFVSTGDLIMPDGALGFSQSVNFSARDVLDSLQKVDALQPDVVLPGHGGFGNPQKFIGAGIRAGMTTGWGMIPPESPDRRYGVENPDTLVVGWGVGATAADFGDIDGDGAPDVALVSPHASGSIIRLYLNREGMFRSEPDQMLDVPTVDSPSRLLLRHINGDDTADLFVSGPRDAAILTSLEGQFGFEITRLETRLREINQLHVLHHSDSGSNARLLLGQRFGGLFEYTPKLTGGSRAMTPAVTGPYSDVLLIDVNGDGRDDVTASNGHVWLRQPDDRLSNEPLALRDIESRVWTFAVSDDFDADGNIDLLFLSSERPTARLELFLNTGHRERPFESVPDLEFDLYVEADGQRTDVTAVRSAPTIVDWNQDGNPDLLIGVSQQPMAIVVFGDRDSGLSGAKMGTVTIDTRGLLPKS